MKFILLLAVYVSAQTDYCALAFSRNNYKTSVANKTTATYPQALGDAVVQYCKDQPCTTLKARFQAESDYLMAEVERIRTQDIYLAQKAAGEWAVQNGVTIGGVQYQRRLDLEMAGVNENYRNNLAYANSITRYLFEEYTEMEFSGFCAAPVSLFENRTGISKRNPAHFDFLGRISGQSTPRVVIPFK